MANGVKEYKIVINGITESINAVDALKKKLDELEQKIDAINKQSISIKTLGVNVGSVSSNVSTPRVSNVSSLSEEEAIQREINKLKAEGERLDAKIAAAQDEIYKRVDATKQLYKETIADQKALAAQERLDANTYNTNTMQGMKERLADLKAVINTTDLSDTDALNKMTQEANQLNEKLKEVEATYGQFGRNVGNYKSAFDGLTIAIGNTTAHFDNAKQAAKELDKEMKTLSTKKDQGIISEEEAQRLKDLIPVVAQIKSSINDAGKPMDALMDSMQSVVAMAQTSKGLSAFFGFDDSEIQKSIQKLVGLQNAMQGIQTIQKQMQSQEGIGALFSKGSDKIDELVAGLTNAKIEAEGLTKASKFGTYAVRGLSMALKGLGIGLVVTAISFAISQIEKLVKSLDTAKIKESALESEANALNKQYELRKELLAGSYMSNAISNEEYLKEQYKIENDYIEEQITFLRERANLLNQRDWLDAEKDFWSASGEYNIGFTGNKMTEPQTVGSWNLIGQFSYEVKNIEEVEDAWKKLNNAVKQGKDYFEEYGEGIGGWFDSMKVSVQETEDVMHGMGNIDLSDTIGSFYELNDKFKKGKISAEDFAKGLKELTDRMNSSDVLQSVIANLDKYIPDEKVREKIENILKYIGRLNDEFNAVSEAQIHHWNQVKIDGMVEGAAKIAAQMAEDERHEIAQYGHTEEQISLIQKKYQQKRFKATQEHNKKLKGEADKNKKAQLEIEKEITQASIAAMKEGLNKTITQLEEERKQRLAKLDKNMKNYKSYELQINNIYNERILSATEDWNLKMEKTYADMWRNINQDTLNNLKEQYELIKQYYEQSGQTPNNMDIGIQATKSYSERYVIPSYGIQAAKGLTGETKKTLGLTATFDTSKFGEDMRKYVDIERQAFSVMQEYYKKYTELQEKMEALKTPNSEENDAILGRLNFELDETLKVHKKLQKEYHDFGKYIHETYNETYGEIEIRKRKNLLYEEVYSEDLSVLFKQRNGNIQREQIEADKRLEEEIESTSKKRKEIVDKAYKVDYEAAKEHWNQISSAASSAHTEELSGLQKQFDEGLLSRKQYNKLQDEEIAQYELKMKEILDNWHTTENNLQIKHQQDLIQIDQDANQKRQDNNKKSFETQLQELRDFQTAIVNIESKQPVQNAWGITNFTETNKNNRNILDSYKTMVERINQMRADLNKKKNEGLIDDEMYSSTLRELDNLSQGIGEKMDEIKQKLSVGEQIGTFISDIQQYFNALGQGLQQIMQALWSAQDVAFDKEKEALDKENEKLQDALDKNEAILEKHKNNVNDIEDELSTARGDRRQHLIDQLNAEISAEREAAAEEKRIKQQQEVQKKKEDALDRKRKEAQYKRDLQSILVSGAMAAVNAYATKPFVPVGLAMGSLSLALTAAQYAIAKSAKPYARGGQLDGGVADGPRHSQGGIKVLGGRAEIEGGEFIINRTSTAKNIDLLEYVNSKKKRVDISDLIDFYSSGKPKRAIQQVKGKFAQGGNLPTLRTDIEINDRLVEAFEDYAKTPNVVQVVDIIDRTKKVNTVKVLAGLSE